MSLGPEKRIEQYFVKQVEKRGGFCRKYTVPGVRGVPDRIVFLSGVWFVEFKAPGKQPTAAQNREFERMANQGGVVFWFNSIVGVDQFFKNYDEVKNANEAMLVQ